MLGQLVLLLQLFLYTLGQEKIQGSPFVKPYQDTWFRKKPPPPPSSPQPLLFPSSSNPSSQEIYLVPSKLPEETANFNAKTTIVGNSIENSKNIIFNNEAYQYYSVPNSTNYEPGEFRSLEKVNETIEHYNLTSNLNLNDDDYYQYFGYKNENNSEIQFNFRKPSEINQSFEENSLEDLIQMPSQNQFYDLNLLGPPTILYPFYENVHLDKNPNSTSTSTTTSNYDLKSNIYNPLYEPLGPTTFYENGQDHIFNQLEIPGPPRSFTTQITPQDLSIIDDLIAISSELISQVMRPGTLTESQEFEIAKNKMGHLQRTFGNLGNMMKNAMNAVQNRIKGGMQMLKKVGGSFKEMFDMMCQIGKQMMRDVGNFVKYMLNMDKGVMGFMSGIFGGGGGASGGYVDGSSGTSGGYGAPAEQNKDKVDKDKGETETTASSDKGSIKAQIAQKKAEAKAKVVEQKKAIKAQKAGGNKDESEEEAENGGWSEEPQSWQDANGQSNEINEWKIPDENDSKINEWMEIMSSNNLIAAPTSHVAEVKFEKKIRKKKKKKIVKKSQSQSDKIPNLDKDSQNHLTETKSGEILVLDLEKKNRPQKKPSNHQQIIQKYFQNSNTNNNQEDHTDAGEEKPPNSHITTISSFEKFGTKYYTNKISKKKKKKGHKNNRPSLSWDFYTFKK